MPYTVILQEKRVKLDKDTTALLKAFKEAYQEAFKDDSGSSPSAVLGDEKLRAGLIPKIVKLYEGISDTKQGASEQTLSPLKHVYLNPYAEQIYVEYVRYLNQMIKECGCTPSETEAEELSSPYVVMRELLLRLVALALSTEMRGDRDGEKLIKVLNDFIDTAKGSSALVKKGFFTSEFSIMQKQLASMEHARWIQTFTVTVEAIKTLTAMTDLITRWLDLLKQRRHQVARYLITLLEPKRKRQELSENWIEDTLSEVEQDLLNQANKILREQEKPILSADNKDEKVLSIIPTAYEISREKISSTTVSATVKQLTHLYSLLKKTVILEKLLSNLEGIHAVLGWFPIIMGIINCHELDNLFTSYEKYYISVYSNIFDPIKKSLGKVPDDSAAAALLAVEPKLHTEKNFSSTSFSALQDTSHLAKIRAFTAAQFHQLNDIQPELAKFFDLKNPILNVKLTDTADSKSTTIKINQPLPTTFPSPSENLPNQQLAIVSKDKTHMDSLTKQKDNALMSLNLYRKKANQGNIEYQFILFTFCNESDDPEIRKEGVKWLIKAANQNHLEAQTELGLLYLKGYEDIKKDSKQAESWLLKSAQQNNAEAAFQLGQYYKTSMPPDLKEAFTWYKKSAELKHIKAQICLGDCYRQGHGTEKDESTAFTWYKKAEKNPIAKVILGRYHQYGRGGATQNLEEALRYYKEAADEKNADAQYYLALCYEKGLGVTPDSTLSLKLFRSAAETGNPYAQNILGSYYEKGYLVSQSLDEAFKWYSEAAKQSHPPGHVSVGLCYSQGIGVPKNETQAFIHYEIAANLGDAIGQHNLASLYQRGVGTFQNYEKAAKWFLAAAQQGDPDSQYHLARCYLHGRGVDKNETEAISWFKKAEAQGHTAAKSELTALEAMQKTPQFQPS